MGTRLPTDAHARAEARDLAERALLFAAARPDVLTALFETSGADAGALRAMVALPEFPRFILDFLLAEDRRVHDFAEAEGLAPEMVARVRARLDAGLSG